MSETITVMSIAVSVCATLVAIVWQAAYWRGHKNGERYYERFFAVVHRMEGWVARGNVQSGLPPGYDVGPFTSELVDDETTGTMQ
jgi:hypothetical protein